MRKANLTFEKNQQIRSETDTRDRVIRLEAKVEQLTVDIAGIDAKVTEIYTLLQQAKGAKWILIVIWLAAGALLGKLLSVAPWLASRSRWPYDATF